MDKGSKSTSVCSAAAIHAHTGLPVSPPAACDCAPSAPVPPGSLHPGTERRQWARRNGRARREREPDRGRDRKSQTAGERSATGGLSHWQPPSDWPVRFRGPAASPGGHDGQRMVFWCTRKMLSDTQWKCHPLALMGTLLACENLISMWKASCVPVSKNINPRRLLTDKRSLSPDKVSYAVTHMPPNLCATWSQIVKSCLNELRIGNKNGVKGSMSTSGRLWVQILVGRAKLLDVRCSKDSSQWSSIVWGFAQKHQLNM